MHYKYNIAMIGAGYVGLISSVCFTELGFNVVCVDKDKNKIKKLSNGNSTIHEPFLTPLLQKNLASGQLKFSDSLSDSVSNSDIIFITVGTPLKKNNEADISEVEKTVEEIAPLLKNYKVIVIKSTVPVGTCRKLLKIIYKLNHNAQCDIVSNPEFLRAGSGIKDFMMPDRIVIGVEKNRAYSTMIQLYQSFMDKKIPLIQTNLESAELIKYAANSYLATKIAFTNEIAYLCEKLEADVNSVLQGIGLDKRIGADYLQPGPGFGGSCLSKDASALTHSAKTVDAPVCIIESVLESNRSHKKRIVEKIIKACFGSVTHKRLAILGMAFKANTDDMRESPALYILTELKSQGAVLNIYDPVVKTISFDLDAYWGFDVYDTLDGADAVIIMTEWDEFRQLDLKKVKASLRETTMEPTLIDLRNLYSPSEVIKAGIRYCSIGRKIQNPALLQIPQTC